MNDLAIATNSDIIRSVAELMELSKTLIRSGLLPKSIATPEAAAGVILMGRELNIGAMTALNMIQPIQGKPTVSPQLMLGLARRTKEFSNLEVKDDGETCTVTVTRKGQSPVTTTFSMQDAEKMGLSTKDNWKKQPKVMRQWRAFAANLRLTFPDAIAGLYTPEEMGAEVIADEEGNMTVTKMPEPVIEGEKVKVIEPPKEEKKVTRNVSLADVPSAVDAAVVIGNIFAEVDKYKEAIPTYFKRNPDGKPTSVQLGNMKGLAASWIERLALMPLEPTADNKNVSEEYRRVFTQVVFGKQHMDELAIEEVGGVLAWLGLEKKKEGDKNIYTATDKTNSAKFGIDVIIRYATEKASKGT